MRLSLFCASMVGALIASGAQSEVDEEAKKARLSRKMFVAFLCSGYSEVSGKNDEAQRLIEIGLSSGRVFFKALSDHEIRDEILSKEVPIGVSMYAGGPNIEFVLGRVFQGVSGIAREKISNTEYLSNYSNPKEFIFDAELRKARAENLYSSTSCELIE